MTTDLETKRQPLVPERSTETVILADDIELDEVASRTGGKFDYLRRPPYRTLPVRVRWEWKDRSFVLDWVDEHGWSSIRGNERVKEPGRTLSLDGTKGMENMGLVMGKDYAAFVYPEGNRKGWLEADVIVATDPNVEKPPIRRLEGPTAMFSTHFLEAQALSNSHRQTPALAVASV